MAKIPDAALTFLRASRISRWGLIRCGFELETQSTEGLKAGEGRGLDEDGYYEEVASRRDQIIGEDLEDCIPATLYTRVREAVENYVQENDDEFRSDFERGVDFDVPSGIIQGEDVSVSGFEFRTKDGGVDYADFYRLSSELFEMEHDIDRACSFHVHLSVKGVKHSYGERLQMALVEYLAENVRRAPKRVRSRWEGVRHNQYISKLVGSDEQKYCFVRKHPQGTWEFRCFGNVKSAREGRVCLDLAIDAMAFAYAVCLGEQELLADTLSRSDWTEAVYTAFETGTPLSSVARQKRRETGRSVAA